MSDVAHLRSQAAPHDDLPSLVEQLRHLEQTIENKLEARRKEMQVQIVGGRVRFERALTEQHRRLKTGLVRFLANSPLIFYLTAPVIYSLIIPFALLDIFVSIYQAICFRAWNIARVNRSDYIALDRHHLAYLNGIQKLNCSYCSYANGVIAFTRDVAARTEQFWCPIKHAMRVRGVHERYRDFIDFGDAEGFVKRSEQYRARLRDADHA
ncbi:MAG: hypothetical protein AB7E79_07630 [Rhodospirillaceae bacterium]